MWSNLKVNDKKRNDFMIKVCPGLRLGLKTALRTDRTPGWGSEKACFLSVRNLWRTAGLKRGSQTMWWLLQWDLWGWCKAESLRAPTRERREKLERGERREERGGKWGNFHSEADKGLERYILSMSSNCGFDQLMLAETWFNQKPERVWSFKVKVS